MEMLHGCPVCVYCLLSVGDRTLGWMCSLPDPAYCPCGCLWEQESAGLCQTPHASSQKSW